VMHDEDDYVAIGRQAGMFIRRAERLFATMRLHSTGRGLDRPAFMLLGRVATRGPIRLSALAADVCLDVSTVSRQVAALETAGLVRRASDTRDRRASLIETTETGVEVFTTNRDEWLATWRDLLAGWTAEDRRTFADLFTRLNDVIAERVPGPGPAPSGGEGK
jgi:DNA-binding MarR family transcriptional regulator